MKAVVTGGASGLGRATAARLVAAGARVALLDRPASAGADVAQEPGTGRRLHARRRHQRRRGRRGRWTARRAACGGINVLVNCAGIGTAMKTFGKAGPAKLEEFTRVIQVNLIGTFNCIRLAAAAHGPEHARPPTASAASSSTPRRSPRSTARSARPPTRPRRAASSA